MSLSQQLSTKVENSSWFLLLDEKPQELRRGGLGSSFPNQQVENTGLLSSLGLSPHSLSSPPPPPRLSEKVFPISLRPETPSDGDASVNPGGGVIKDAS